MKKYTLLSLLLPAVVLNACTCGSPTPEGNAIDAAKSSITVDRAEGAVADGNDPVTITVKLVDASDKPVSGAIVSLKVTGTGNVVSALAASDADGVTTAQLRSTTAETKDISAEAAQNGSAITLAQHASTRFGVGAAARLSFSVPPSAAQAGAPIAPAIQVRVEDASGNVVKASTEMISLSLEGGPAGATLGGTVQVAAVDGVATFADLEIDKAGKGYVLTATTGGQPGLVTKSASFDITVGPPARLEFETHPPLGLVAGVPFGLAVTVRDSEGNFIPESSAPVTLAVASGPAGALLDGTLTVAAVNGVAAFSGLGLTTAGTNYTLAATASGFMGATSNTFVVKPAAPARSASSIAITPDTLVADGSAGATVTVHARDIYGNGIADVPVEVAIDGTGNTLTPDKGTTDAAGLFAPVLTSTVAEAKTVTASVEDFSLTAPVTFVAGPADLVKTTIAVAPATVTADGATTALVTVTARDANGNVVEGAKVAITLSGTGNTLTTPSGSTNAAGVFTTTLASTVAELKVVTALVDTFSVSTPVTFEPGAPDATQTTLVASPSTTPAGTASTLLLTVKDAFGNLVPGRMVTFASTGSANVFSPQDSGITDANGALTVALSSTTAETKTITAQVDTIAPTTTVTFHPGPPNAMTTTFGGTPASAVANGVAAISFTLAAKDEYGNPIPNEAVSLSSSGTANTLTPPSGPTDANGVFSATLASTKAEAKLVTATIAGVSFNFTVTFVAGPVDATKSTFSASPASQPANGTSQILLAVSAKDTFGNAISGQSVSLSSSGTANAIAPASGTTDPTGVFTAQHSSTRAEPKTVSAVMGGITLFASVAFTPGAPSAAQSTLVATPTSALANGTAKITLVVTVRDAFGNFVPGAPVSMSSTGSNNAFTPTSSGLTNASGVFTVSLASTTGETKTVTASLPGGTVTTTVSFKKTPACADIVTTQNVWGLASKGVLLGAYTNGTLEWIGCPGNGCSASEFFCTDESSGIVFGVNTTNVMRALIDPNNTNGNTIPQSFTGCCSASSPRSICNAPVSTNNGVGGINAGDALCKAMGFSSGTVVLETLNDNVCPKAHTTTANGSNWTSDFLGVAGFGRQYRCFF